MIIGRMPRYPVIAGVATLLALSLLPGRVGGAAPAAPTYTQDVAPILNKHCVRCHRPGEVAPMSLMTYDEARPWARAIKTQVMAGAMPPWAADPRFGIFA